MPTYYQKHKTIQAVQFDGTIQQLIENFPDWTLTFCQNLENKIEYDDHHLIQSIRPIDTNLISKQFHWWPKHPNRKNIKYKPLRQGDYLVFYTHVVKYYIVNAYTESGENITPDENLKQHDHLMQQVNAQYWHKIKAYRQPDPNDYTDIRILTNHIGPEKDKHYQYLRRRYFNIWPQAEFESQWSKTPLKKAGDNHAD